MHPGQPIVNEQMPCRFQIGCAVKRADMEMGFHRKALVLACHGRAAPGAEAALCTGRGTEFGDRAMCNGDGFMIEGNKNGGWRSAMLAAALAMAPKNPIRLTGSAESHGTAQASAFVHFAHSRMIDDCAVEINLPARLLRLRIFAK